VRKNGPVILTILDGWGHRVETHANAIALARKPTYDMLLREYPNTLIRASEHFVGLPDGQMGNSEVGCGARGADGYHAHRYRDCEWGVL
jgi:2,3-bisphosphoglycerate-independent phosphoglycerate mutase